MYRCMRCDSIVSDPLDRCEAWWMGVECAVCIECFNDINVLADKLKYMPMAVMLSVRPFLERGMWELYCHVWQTMDVPRTRYRACDCLSCMEAYGDLEPFVPIK